MTEIIVQHFVENLLKVLKVLKTRTALIMNELSELRIRYARKGAKAPSKQRNPERLQNYYKMQKELKKLLTSDKIKLEKERMVQHHERLR